MQRVAVTHGLKTNREPYMAAVRDAGLDPVSVNPLHPLSSLTGIDGLLLCGGSDLDPSMYGQQRRPEGGDPDRERDALEQRLLAEALTRDVPLLAICRGLQLFNVAHPGGTLVQHMHGHRIKQGDPSEPAHDVIVEPGTRLAEILGATSVAVNSRHHQAVDRVGEGLIVSGRSAGDRVIEALERADRRFAIAVQWHPEDQVARFPEARRLFVAFAAAL